MTWHRSRRKKPTYDPGLGRPTAEVIGIEPSPGFVPPLMALSALEPETAAELRTRFADHAAGRPMVLPGDVEVVELPDPVARLDAEMWRRLRAYASSGP